MAAVVFPVAMPSAISIELQSNTLRALKKLARLRPPRSLPAALGVEVDEEAESPWRLPPLDRALKTHLKKLPSNLLASLFAASFQQATDNAGITITVASELARRRDLKGQLAVVKSFQAALRHTDAGHRLHECTVHDQLCDSVFPRFEAKPLVNLLAWCTNAHLSPRSDGMQHLFIPAFKKAVTKDDAARLVRRWVAYVGNENHEALWRTVRRASSPRCRRALDALNSERLAQRTKALVNPVLAEQRRVAGELASSVTAALSAKTKDLEPASRAVLNVLNLESGVVVIDGGALEQLARRWLTEGRDADLVELALSLGRLSFHRATCAQDLQLDSPKEAPDYRLIRVLILGALAADRTDLVPGLFKQWPDGNMWLIQTAQQCLDVLLEGWSGHPELKAVADASFVAWFGEPSTPCPDVLRRLFDQRESQVTGKARPRSNNPRS